MKLNENISRLRKSRGLTQEQLAKILNVSVTAVSKWENGNNRPDLEILPDLADVFQVSIDSLLGYEKSYRNLDKCLAQISGLLTEEQYKDAITQLRELIKGYPNDFRVNKLLADAYYSLVFSEEENRDINSKNAVFYYERSIELWEEKYQSVATVEMLEIQIATCFLAQKEHLDDAMKLIEKHNHNAKYNNLLAQCLFESGQADEAKALILKHCVSEQVFVFNDLTVLADMFVREENYETAIAFLEAEAQQYTLFMKDEGGYADRAYAGKAVIIRDLYRKLGDTVNADAWHEKAVQHAKRYSANPSMQISSLKYCDKVLGRMIDNEQDVIRELSE